MDTPRERHGETWSGWVEGVVLDRLVPQDWAEVIQMAVTRSLYEVLREPSGGWGSGSARARYSAVGLAVGMRRETFRATYHGARWVTMPELARLEASALTGPPLRRHLVSLGTQVLRMDQDRGPTQRQRGLLGLPSTALPYTDGVAPSIDGVPADALEASRVPPKMDRPGLDIICDSHVCTTMSHAGSESSAFVTLCEARPPETFVSMVRNALEPHRQMHTYQIVSLVNKRHPGVSYKQVQDALTRLVRQGELDVVERGKYRRRDNA